MENEFMNQIGNDLAEYGNALSRVGKMRLIGIISRIAGLFLLIFTVVLLVFALLSFAAVAVIDALATVMPIWAAALIVAGFYLLLIVIAIACRKPLFVHPFIGLMAKQFRTEEELALQTLEAEHAAELQRMRVEGKVENAVRTVDIVFTILGNLKQILFRKRRKE